MTASIDDRPRPLVLCLSTFTLTLSVLNISQRISQPKRDLHLILVNYYLASQLFNINPKSMPTPIDRALHQKAPFLAFAGIITAVAAWSIWGPESTNLAGPDPTGDPETWTREQLRTWLNNRRLLPSGSASREELLAQVQKRMRRDNAK